MMSARYLKNCKFCRTGRASIFFAASGATGGAGATGRQETNPRRHRPAERIRPTRAHPRPQTLGERRERGGLRGGLHHLHRFNLDNGRAYYLELVERGLAATNERL